MRARIKIYGERNTSTTYLGRLIELNLDVEQLRGTVPRPMLRLQRLLPGDEWLRDAYFALTFRANLGWKHRLAPAADELGKLQAIKKGVALVTLTKNPYSWLLSLYRNPYHADGKRPDNFVQFLCQPWRTTRRDGTARLLKSPVELWNLKNASYLGLASLSALNITTEQLFADPAGIIERIARCFSIRRTADGFTDHLPSTKNASWTGADYRDYYLNEKWRDELGETAIEIIDQALDQRLLAVFGYRMLGQRKEEQ